MRMALSLFYRQCEVVLSPSPAADESLAGLGIEPERIGRWARGVDLAPLRPAPRRDPGAYPGEVKVLYAGRLTREKGADLLAESFLRARERDPRLHLLLAGGGPEEEHAARCASASTRPSSAGSTASELADAYASADVFLFCSRTDTYGQVIAEAQASGLPVVAVGEGGPATLIRDRQTGLALRAEPGGARRRGRPARGVAVPARAPIARRRSPRSAGAPGRRRWPSSPPATSARSGGRAGASPAPTPLREVA